MSPRQVPVAEYVRMSTEDQQYSIPNQQAAIRRYADEHGFSVSRTYADCGKSGVLIRHREGLRHLLKDVLGGIANFKAIIVYDVSRWGRFQNPDEAAHYDFICANAGIPVHYCGEQFSNDGSMQSSLMKAIKRTMAGEFSRELGVKVFDGLKRLVLEGYHAGAVAPYGLERMLISPSGHRKGVLRTGEKKNLKTDKVILVRGKSSEIRMIRRIFSLCANERKNSWQIAADLNSKRLTFRGKPWTCERVLRILKSSQYLGLNVWARRQQRLHGPSSLRPESSWVVSKAPFKGLVDRTTFERAQQVLAAHKVHHTSEALLTDLRRLLARKSRLSSRIIDRHRGGGSSSAYFHRFGSLLRAYKLVGFEASSSRIKGTEHSCRTRSLHEATLQKIKVLFSNEVRISSLGRRHKHFIEVDGRIEVSILLCGMHTRQAARGKGAWLIRTSQHERQTVALVCLLDSGWQKVVSCYAVPAMGDLIKPHHTLYKDDLLLTTLGIKLQADLSDFCQVVRDVAGQGS